MQWLKHDTIAAIATAVGEGGIGVIRISGPQALDATKALFEAHKPIETWRSHRLYYGHCVDEAGEMLDEVMVVWMAAGRSFTGEDVVEIHGHGGKLNLLQLLRRVLEVGPRAAEAGEFTRRAFLNGRIDLTQAEAVADLIAAKNEQALKVARSHLQGRLQRHLDELAQRSLTLAAQVESWIDFPEEFDPAMDQAVARVVEDVRDFAKALTTLRESYALGQQLQDGWSILLLGRPNAGKSSLFNQLGGEDRAIVTDLPGTTRDLLETQIALSGVQLTLIDTAGLRDLSVHTDNNINDTETRSPDTDPARASAQDDVRRKASAHDAIERMGVERAMSAAARAHLLLAVVDISRPWSEEDQKVLEACEGRDVILIENKADLPQVMDEAKIAQFRTHFRCRVSCATGEGIATLQQSLRSHIDTETPAHALVITNERQYRGLGLALDAVQKALEQGMPLGPEFMAEDLRSAREALVSITGQVSSEDILEHIFSSFCIGK